MLRITVSPAHTATDQHHHHLRGAGLLGKKFGVAGEGNTGIVDYAFVHRRSDHAGELT